MTREEAKEKMFKQWQEFLENNIDYAGISEAYKMAISALEQEPCDDAISRDAVIEAIASNDSTNGTVAVFTGKQVIAMINKLPSVRPQEQKIGQWIDREVYDADR